MNRILLLIAFPCVSFLVAAANPSNGWLSSWTAGPQQQIGALKRLSNQTIRAYVPLSAGGSRIRIRFSNEYGTKPLLIGTATAALVAPDNSIQPATLQRLTFGGAASIEIPIGAPAYSDPIDLKVPASATLAVSLFLPRETLPETYHRPVGGQDNPGTPKPIAEISADGDFTAAPKLPGAAPSPYLFLTRVDVFDPRAAGVVAVMGTTRTAGPGHWPQFLAERLNRTGRPISIVNASLVANPLTHPYPGGGEAGLARFDRDVLLQPGLTHVVLADSINDIGQPGLIQNGQVVVPAELPTVQHLASAYLQLTARAKAQGVKVIAATVMPFEGVPFAGFYSPEKEKLRLALNEWIRASKAFDGIIVLDAIMRDPKHPSTFLPDLHTANNFAPNDAGEHRIANAIDLKLFR